MLGGIFPEAISNNFSFWSPPWASLPFLRKRNIIRATQDDFQQHRILIVTPWLSRSLQKVYLLIVEYSRCNWYTLPSLSSQFRTMFGEFLSSQVTQFLSCPCSRPTLFVLSATTVRIWGGFFYPLSFRLHPLLPSIVEMSLPISRYLRGKRDQFPLYLSSTQALSLLISWPPHKISLFYPPPPLKKETRQERTDFEEETRQPASEEAQLVTYSDWEMYRFVRSIHLFWRRHPTRAAEEEEEEEWVSLKEEAAAKLSSAHNVSSYNLCLWSMLLHVLQ